MRHDLNRINFTAECGGLKTGYLREQRITTWAIECPWRSVCDGVAFGQRTHSTMKRHRKQVNKTNLQKIIQKKNKFGRKEICIFDYCVCVLGARVWHSANNNASLWWSIAYISGMCVCAHSSHDAHAKYTRRPHLVIA